MSEGYSVLIDEAERMVWGVSLRLDERRSQLQILLSAKCDAISALLQEISSLERGLRTLQNYRAVLLSADVVDHVLPEYAHARLHKRMRGACPTGIPTSSCDQAA